MSYSPDKILLRLEELKKWQQIQEQRLLQHEIKKGENINDKESNNNSVVDINTPGSNLFITNKENVLTINKEKYLATLTNSVNTQINRNHMNHFILNIDEQSSSPLSNYSESVDKLKVENDLKKYFVSTKTNSSDSKECIKPFLKKGVGMSRFGMTREDFKSSNIKMPWLKHKSKNRKTKKPTTKRKLNFNINSVIPNDHQLVEYNEIKQNYINKNEFYTNDNVKNSITTQEHILLQEPKLISKIKECILTDHSNRSNSPDASLIMSPSLSKITNEKENAEQNIFNLIEKKTANDNFSINDSFIVKILSLINTESEIADISKHLQILNLQTPTDNEHNIDKCYQADDSDESMKTSSVSSDTEETCKIVINKEIPTSTPNQCINNEENKTKESTNDSNINIYLNNQMKEINGEIDQNFSNKENRMARNKSFDNLDFVSKTELLKTRLQELETEIKIFQSENAILDDLKKEIQQEKAEFFKSKTQWESKINEDKVIAEYYLAEEKEKLQKQKLLYDRHVKEMKMQNSKKQREEISQLQGELSNLKEQMNIKDSKFNTTQARLRNQVKVLEKERNDFKEECEKLKKENKKLSNLYERTQRLKNIKLLADINKSIGTNIELEYEHIPSDQLFLRREKKNGKENKMPTVINHNLRSRTQSAPNLSVESKYAKYFSKKNEIQKNTDELQFRIEDKNYSDTSNNSIDIYDNHLDLNKNGEIRDTESTQQDKYDKNKGNIEKMYSLDNENKGTNFSNPCKSSINDSSFKSSDIQKKRLSESLDENISSQNSIKSVSTKQSDGSTEIIYSNGNRKIISQDGSHSKFIFYNGDIKEIFVKDGIIKYYYNEVNVHHTSYKDGLEILQFPDGYIERRYKDGAIQAHLPNGTIRWMKPSKDEEWKFPDGTLVSVNSTGEQTLRFPNGQVEIHTSEFRKREFPDGTIKIIYADGIIETRYSNGRIRVKDKHGNLIMDSPKKFLK